MALGLMAQLRNKIGMNDEYEDDEYFDEEDDYYPEEKPVKKLKAVDKNNNRSFGKITPFTANKKADQVNGRGQVYMLSPTSMEDCHAITDKLLEKYTVVLNTESCDSALAQRILDYTCGTVYSLGCSFGRVSYSAQNTPVGIFVVTPEQGELNGDFKEDVQ